MRKARNVTRCSVCGSHVRVETSTEGTGCYIPLSAELASLLDRIAAEPGAYHSWLQQLHQLRAELKGIHPHG